ncbi:MAG: carbohydrate ABC transporter permease, partial [Acetanaerobacterium sp.]
LTTIIPLLWVFLNSFKGSDEILRNSISLPEKIQFTNYLTTISYPDVNMLRAFMNSLIISGSVVLGVIVFAGLAAFALARFDSKIVKYINLLLVASLLVPMFSTMIPNFVLINSLPLKGTYFAVIVPQIAGNICFSTLLLTGYMRSLPIELDEAAIIDGASVMQIFRKIIFPLTLPMFSTVGIMVFIWSYNDLLTSLVYLPTRSLQPICVILSLVSNMFGTDYGALMAAIVITMVPLLVLYIVSQEQVVKGLTAGAVKG